MSDDDRRKSPRLPAQIEINFPNLESLKVAYTRDLSKGGLFFVADQPLPEKQVFDFQLKLPSSNLPFTLRGKIVHTFQFPDASFGIGVEFVELTEQQRLQISNLIENIETGALVSASSIEVKFIYKGTAKKEESAKEEAQEGTPDEANETQAFAAEIASLEKLAKKEDLYRIFKLDKQADKRAVRKAYHKFCNEYHPDLHMGNIEPQLLERLNLLFDKVTTIYKTLKDSKKRDAYDKETVVKKSSVLTMQQKKRQKFEAGNQEQVEQAERLHSQALESIAEDNLKAALNNLKLAVTLHPLHPEYQKTLREVEEKLKS